MAATRSPSPADRASAPGSPELTPRSKLKAMLAAVDESSDEDVGPIDTKALFRRLDQSKADGTVTEQSSTLAARSNHVEGEHEDEEDESEEEVVRPRGRVAARMLGLQQKDTASETSELVKTPQRRAKLFRRQVKSSSPAQDEDETQQSRQVDPESITKDRLQEDGPASPGLFVSPSPAKSTRSHPTGIGASDSEDELPPLSTTGARFQALLARKREERLAREAEEERKRQERREHVTKLMPAGLDGDEDDDISDISDDDGGRKLTQDARASKPRKASKKAIEAMNRETQRMNRSLQLAHEAKTKKKITKASLLERFNYKLTGDSVVAEAALSSDKVTNSSRPATPVSAGQTDAEMAEAGTPPSSPPSALKLMGELPTTEELVATAQAQKAQQAEEKQMTDHNDHDASLTPTKAESKTNELAGPREVSPFAKQTAARPKRQVRLDFAPIAANTFSLDSDDELEITVPKKNKIDSILERMPSNKAPESRSMHALRQLAQLSSPPQRDRRKKSQKPSITAGELQMNLQQRARAQAKLERERRLDMLKSKGVVVQTEEERERQREQVEDIVARARQEAEEIMAKEREDAKKARKEKRKNGEGEDDPIGFDDSDDDSFEEEDLDEEGAEVELSGSEQEEDGDEDATDPDDDADDEEDAAPNPLFDQAAEEDGDVEEDEAQSEMDDEDLAVLSATMMKRNRNKKHVRIVSDDEDDEEPRQTTAVDATPRPKATLLNSPAAPSTGSPLVPKSVLRSATKTFIPGLPVPLAGPAGLGLTQIFAGTMENSQDDDAADGSPVEFMPSFDGFPDSQFSATLDKSQETGDMVLSSQDETQNTAKDSQAVQLQFQQSQMHGFDSLLNMTMDATQASDMILPTQDGGFAEYTPLKERFIDPPQSTVETVLLARSQEDEAVVDSPLVRKKGKLRRRVASPEATASVDVASLPATEEAPRSLTTGEDADAMGTEESASAFKLMEKAAKRKKRMQEKFDKAKSEAAEMVDVQAEESEDEYAGLGGADGEDSSDDDEQLNKEMIDDAEGNDVDEQKLASFFADRERAADSAQVDKLFRDLTTGMLRKRRRHGGGNDFDLSDSDDGGEARRRMKRRQFAKMQKALFADERIGKIAENPRNAAFLKSIEDRGSEDEWDFGENLDEDKVPEVEDSQEAAGAANAASQNEHIPDSQPLASASANVGRKRTRQEPAAQGSDRPPAKMRRIRGEDAHARPASLADVRRSLSSLLDDPHGSVGSVVPATQLESDSEGEGETRRSPSNKENRRPSSVAVVDRISLTRSGSSAISNINGPAGGRLAFGAPGAAAAATAGGFKVPSLLRRATTNSLISNGSSSSSSASAQQQKGAGGFGEEAKLKRNAGKMSGVNYFARENERREKLREGEKRREAKKWKGVEGRGKIVGGLFGRGQFD